MSDLTPRGIIDGIVYRGGGGGVTDYDDLTNRPKINNVTLTGNKTTQELGLADLDDIPIIGINLTPTALYRAETITLNGAVYKLKYEDFEGTDGADDGSNGLVPAPEASDYGKFLASSGEWENIPINQINYNNAEQDTGIKWIDNKTIYQKTIIFKQNNVDFFTYDNNEYLQALPANIEFIRVNQIYLNRNGSDYIDVGLTGGEIIIVPNPTTRNVYITSNHSPTNIIITFQYTKQ